MKTTEAWKPPLFLALKTRPKEKTCLTFVFSNLLFHFEPFHRLIRESRDNSHLWQQMPNCPLSAPPLLFAPLSPLPLSLKKCDCLLSLEAYSADQKRRVCQCLKDNIDKQLQFPRREPHVPHFEQVRCMHAYAHTLTHADAQAKHKSANTWTHGNAYFCGYFCTYPHHSYPVILSPSLACTLISCSSHLYHCNFLPCFSICLRRFNTAFNLPDLNSWTSLVEGQLNPF